MNTDTRNAFNAGKAAERRDRAMMFARNSTSASSRCQFVRIANWHHEAMKRYLSLAKLGMPR